MPIKNRAGEVLRELESEGIEAAPERLREVDGIGPVRAASILAAWAEQKAVRGPG